MSGSGRSYQGCAVSRARRLPRLAASSLNYFLFSPGTSLRSIRATTRGERGDRSLARLDYLLVAQQFQFAANLIAGDPCPDHSVETG